MKNHIRNKSKNYSNKSKNYSNETAISQFFANLESENYKKAVALVVSARERGNSYDFAEYMLKRLEAAHVETELINLEVGRNVFQLLFFLHL